MLCLHCDGLRCGPADPGLLGNRGPRLLGVLRRHVPGVSAVGLHDAGLHDADCHLPRRHVLCRHGYGYCRPRLHSLRRRHFQRGFHALNLWFHGAIRLPYVVGVMCRRHLLCRGWQRYIQHCVYTVSLRILPADGDARQWRHQDGLRKLLQYDGLRCGPADPGLLGNRGPRLLGVLRRHVPGVSAVGLHDAGLHDADCHLPRRHVLCRHSYGYCRPRLRSLRRRHFQRGPNSIDHQHNAGDVLHDADCHLPRRHVLCRHSYGYCRPRLHSLWRRHFQRGYNSIDNRHRIVNALHFAVGHLWKRQLLQCPRNDDHRPHLLVVLGQLLQRVPDGVDFRNHAAVKQLRRFAVVVMPGRHIRLLRG
jgi:hypothetical protein